MIRRALPLLFLAALTGFFVICADVNGAPKWALNLFSALVLGMGALLVAVRR